MNQFARSLSKFLRFSIVAWLIIVFYFQVDIGIADNSDFTRIMTHFTSGPLDLAENWPDSRLDPDLWEQRFFSYWIPYWRLDFPAIRPTLNSSVLLLWLPSIGLNYLFYSQDILYIHALSLLPRLLIIGSVLMLFKWIDRQVRPKIRPLLYLTFVFPLVLIFSTSDYTAYFNTFYFETASIVYLLLFLVSLLFLGGKKRWRWLLGSLFALTLLVLAKPSNIYWAVLGVPVVLYLSGFRPKRLYFCLTTLFFTVTLLFLSRQLTFHPTLANYNQHNSLFYGVLMLSDDPNTRLEELGLASAKECTGKMVFTPIGRSCFHVYQQKMAFSNSVRVLLHEPMILLRLERQIADAMHTLRLNYLGRRAEFDPIRTNYQLAEGKTLNLWSTYKARHFPTGSSLFGTLLIASSIFVVGIYQTHTSNNSKQHNDGVGRLSIIGLLFTIACLLDMNIAFLGDGNQELRKHLVTANLLFDCVLIVAINVGLTLTIYWYLARSKENLR